jgi:formylglycine-generating enzyme required for sulfatase activity
VTIAYAFEVSRYPITRGEWRRFLTDTGRKSGPCWGFNPRTGGRRFSAEYNWTNPGFPPADSHPVVCVSWAETQAYIAWLNTKSGSRYRLLTEAEYEFVSRAGSSAAYPWGSSSDAQCSHANAADLTARERIEGLQGAACSDGFVYTSPVGSFTANAFGLYDTVGNVWSWTQDCYHTSYNGAPTDGSAWGTSCDRRVVRGGGWESLGQWLRSAYRNNIGDAYYNVGFRVARTLP